MGKRILAVVAALAMLLACAAAQAEEETIKRGAYIRREAGGEAVYAPDGTLLYPAGTWARVYRDWDHWIRICDEDWYEGLLAPDGSVLLKPDWTRVAVDGDRIIAHGNGRAVFMDLSGAVLAEADGYTVKGFFGDRTELIRESEPNWNKRYGLVDRDGHVVVEPEWHFLEWDEATAEMGVAFVERDDLWGLIDPDGNVVLEPSLEDLKWYRAGDGLVAAKAADMWGFIDAAGQWRVPARYDDVRAFHGGYAVARKGAKRWIIDRDGTEICALPECDNAETLNGGYVVCEDYEVDAVCDEVAEARLYRIDGDRLRRLDDGGLTDVSRLGDAGDAAAVFAVEDGGGWNLLDADGKRLNAAPLDDWPVFKEGLAVVCIDGKYAAVDMDGRAIASGYEDMTEFYKGHAIVRNGDDYFLLDAEGGAEPVDYPAWDGETDAEGWYSDAVFNLSEYYGCSAGEYEEF